MAFTQQVLCASLPEGTSVAGRLGSDNAIEAEPFLHRRSRPKFLQDRFEQVAAITGEAEGGEDAAASNRFGSFWEPKVLAPRWPP
jgi:hypothetical protein